MQLNDAEIKKIYQDIESEWSKNLKGKGVALPRLIISSKYSKDALTLIYLYKNLGKKVTKTELTEFMKEYHDDVNDVQQARHLSAQKGWPIMSGQRGDIPAKELGLGPGEYMMLPLEKEYPGFTMKRREISKDLDQAWELIKKEYDYRCATCGSKEGEPNFHYPNSKTVLTKGHMDPKNKLTHDNMIPQCEKCNRPDRNYFIYNKKGRVIAISDPSFILKSTDDVKKQAFLLLKKEFEKS